MKLFRWREKTKAKSTMNSLLESEFSLVCHEEIRLTFLRLKINARGRTRRQECFDRGTEEQGNYESGM